ncbi:metallophosphoesterase family protein [Parapedobacter koreensis]|uniref:Calcineurin-like phosphoesterase n=1 Tax=Parapedobacter koreensis TaxID=332977 RepID=A0A1H7FN99_9SPHI|nr:metallophosphoesterase [Parapedobacter koreensis]SEK26697.1 Calcineurin-like phosphoesterase [Parapedobacter koreensis]
MNVRQLISFVLIFCGSLGYGFSQSAQSGKTDFSFVFMTDVHIRPDSAVVAAFNRAIDTINKLDVDFVISGGDQVYDVMRGNKAKSDTLFTLYKTLSGRIKVPVHNTVGNHELFGIYPESVEDSTHADYKYGMFRRYFGDTYYAFDHKGWHFIVLNALDVADQKYFGQIGTEQLRWLQRDLAAVSPETPIVVTLHIPLVSVFNQVYPRPGQNNDDGPGIVDRDELLAAFKGHKLKLVLQGHLHWLEDLNVESRTHFITGGSVAGRPTWRGTNFGPRGFLLFDVKDDRFSWEYIKYEQPMN